MKGYLDVYTPEDVRALLDLCPPRRPSGIRTRAIIATLYGSGIRTAELVALRPSDIDLERMEVVVQFGAKTGRRRVVPLMTGTEVYIERWLATRERLGCRGNQPAFCTFSDGACGNPMAPRDVRYTIEVLERRAIAAGFEKRIHCHGFRHAFAYRHHLVLGTPLAVLQALLGHATLSATQSYLRRIGADRLLEAARGVPSGL